MSMDGKFDKTKAERIGDLLNSQNIPMQSFVVPRFQRNYAWKPDGEAEKLWNDIYNNYIEYKEDTAENLIAGQYMLGPMVLLEDKGKKFEWQVIDGQQRLATLTTLFCVIRDIFFVFKDKLDDDDGYKLAKTLIEKETFGAGKEPKLQLNHIDKEFFAKIQAENDPDVKISMWNNDTKDKKKIPGSHKRLMKCYEEFYDEVKRALLTEFIDSDEIGEKMNELETELKNSIIADMEKDPVKYSLDRDFFAKHWNRKEFLQDNKISEKEHRDYERIKDKPSGKKYKNVNEYVAYRIEQQDKKFKKILGVKIKEKRSSMLKTNGLKNIHMLTKFLRHIIRQNFVVSVKVKDENDAFMIFETLNERGKRLSKSELVKNMCFGVIKDEKEIEGLDDRWIKIFNTDLDNGDKFIRESLRSRYFDKHKNPNSKSPKKFINASTAHLFKIIKSIINDDPEMARRYVDWLERDSKFVKFMDNPNSYTDNEIIKYNLTALKWLNAVSIRIPILTAYRRWDSGKDFVDFSDMLVKFHFRNRTIGQKHPSEIELHMLEIANMIKDGKSMPDIINVLCKEDLGDEEFEDRFYKSRPEESDIIKYILLEIERHLRGEQGVLQLKTDATVEHILPKTPGKDWSPDDFFDRQNDNDEREFKSYQDRIGNMTLLTRGPNSKIKNKSFCVKKTEVYVNEDTLQITAKTVLKMLKCEEESEMDISDETEDIKEWTAKIIDKRSRCFAKLAKIIWSL